MFVQKITLKVITKKAFESSGSKAFFSIYILRGHCITSSYLYHFGKKMLNTLISKDINMNHPEFSNTENSGFFTHENDFYDGFRTVSRCARKAG